MLCIRPAAATDLPALRALFEASVTTVLAAYYTPRQVDLWAMPAGLPEWWTERLETAWFAVAELDDEPAGFCVLLADGNLEMLYTAPALQGRGVARALVEAAEAECRKNGLHWIVADASIAARPVFERLGFLVLRAQTAEAGGAPFINYKMIKDLS